MSGVKLGGRESDLTIPECGFWPLCGRRSCCVLAGTVPVTERKHFYRTVHRGYYQVQDLLLAEEAREHTCVTDNGLMILFDALGRRAPCGCVPMAVRQLELRCQLQFKAKYKDKV